MTTSVDAVAGGMTIGVSLSTFASDPATSNVVDRAIELADEAGRVGIDTVWLAQLFGYEAISVAALVGREVPSVGVGTSVVPIHPRHPIHLAGAAKTAQAATHGRFQLGIGLGAPALTGPTFGVDLAPAIRGLRDHLGALRPLLDGEQQAYHSPSVTSAPPLPTSVAGAEPRIPLIVAAMGEQALRATGELADGTLPFLAGPKVIREHIAPILRSAAEAAGRPEPRIIVAVPAVVTDDVDAARVAAREASAFYDEIPSYQKIIARNGSERASDLFLLGDEATVLEGLQEYLDAGATEITLTQNDIVGDEARARTWAAVGAWSRESLDRSA
ncbi:TIGR03564 family F420-dependent LLM class oxidoreductase [Gordonia soli]|uniref:Putative F420-dependent oxidoreductase n=1 Tax=Gordonia soli NBRC 108243 TaxID=1223545 RepID=M0QN73_9ACTN|nr:TIGR03564 family F420-dependent LLM class oxidoreductase [Gordonia soli]GAC70120.1 putative F420-dependent oxidoreductase [Gordonia soli NBRC 108243]